MMISSENAIKVAMEGKFHCAVCRRECYQTREE